MSPTRSPAAETLREPRPAPRRAKRKARARGGRVAPDAEPLGTDALNSYAAGQEAEDAEREDRRRGRRTGAYALLRSIQEWTQLERLQHCRKTPVNTVNGMVIKESSTSLGRRWGASGLQHCGSPWSCPVCAITVAAHRSVELTAILSHAAECHCSVAMFTFTQRHREGDDLVAMWNAMSKAWAATTGGRYTEGDRVRFGLNGMIKIVECTHGEHGWHLHLHVLVVFDGPCSWERAYLLGEEMFTRWQRSLIKQGRRSPLQDDGGLDVRMVDLGEGAISGMAEYLSKIVFEAVSGGGKVARKAGNRTPFQIAADAAATGLMDDIELWWTWEQVSLRRRGISFHGGIREWAGLDSTDLSDEEIVDEDRGGEAVLAIDAEDTPAVAARLPELLDVGEREGLEAAKAWLTVRGYRWSTPESRPCWTPPNVWKEWPAFVADDGPPPF